MSCHSCHGSRPVEVEGAKYNYSNWNLARTSRAKTAVGSLITTMGQDLGLTSTFHLKGSPCRSSAGPVIPRSCGLACFVGIASSKRRRRSKWQISPQIDFSLRYLGPGCKESLWPAGRGKCFLIVHSCSQLSLGCTSSTWIAAHWRSQLHDELPSN